MSDTRSVPRLLVLIGILMAPGALASHNPDVLEDARDIYQATMKPPRPLVNADFEVGMPEPVRDPGPAGELVFDSIGSKVPGQTDANANRPALGWTWRVLSGQALPHGRVTWDPTGAVAVDVDRRDTGPGTGVLTQPLGRRPEAGFWTNAVRAEVHVRHEGGTQVEMRALYSSMEDPYVLTVSQPWYVRPGFDGVVKMPFLSGQELHLTQFYLAFVPQGGDATLILDDVRLAAELPSIGE